MITDEMRSDAMASAVNLHQQRFSKVAKYGGLDAARDEVLETYEVILARLGGTTSMTLTWGLPRDQDTGQVYPWPKPPGDDMTQIPAGWEVDLTVDTKDKRGFKTSDLIEYVLDPADGVATVEGATDEDSHTVTVKGAAPGSAVLTITDNAVTPPLMVTHAIDVVPGGTATVEVTAGEPRESV